MAWTKKYAENRKRKRRADAKKHGWPEKSPKRKRKIAQGKGQVGKKSALRGMK